jgi:transcriptional regulator with XRE-family HTH domain
MSTSKELGAFLRSRRARVQPEDVGMRPHGGVRRVPGLRREELAQLAGVSFDYYVRLEQGRSRNVSETVLEAITRALQLDEAERAHLFDLARPSPARRTPERPQRVRPGLQRVLDTIENAPAFILGRRMDVLAWNRLAAELPADWASLPTADRNIARFVFVNPLGKERFVDWDSIARLVVGVLRMEAGRHPDDPKLAGLIGELSVKSAEFSRLWSRHDVREKTFGPKRLHHPLAGEIEIAYEALQPAGDPDQTLYIYTVEPGSKSEQALQLLGSWVAGERTAPATENSNR